MVNALALVFGEKDYTSFIDYVNTEITHYKREVLNQKSTSPFHFGRLNRRRHQAGQWQLRLFINRRKLNDRRRLIFF